MLVTIQNIKQFKIIVYQDSCRANIYIYTCVSHAFLEVKLLSSLGSNSVRSIYTYFYLYHP